MLDDRYDEAPVQGYGDAQIDVLSVDDVVAIHRGVHHREGLKTLDDGLHDEGHETQFGTVGFFEGPTMLGPEARHIAHVHFEDRVNMRAHTQFRVHHVVRDNFSHAAHGLDLHAFASAKGRNVGRRRHRKPRNGAHGGGAGIVGGGHLGHFA